MNGKQAETELEVTEFIENQRVRLVADSHGTRWDTVQAQGELATLMTMDAKANRLLPKLVNRLIMITGMINKAVASDMDAVKSYCEPKSAGS